MIPADAQSEACLDDCEGVPTPLTADLAHRIMRGHAHWSGSPCPKRAAALELLVRLGRYVPDSRRRHVRVRFPAADLSLDFQCDREAAEAFAARMSVRADSTVTTDCRVHPDMPPLPCARLWSVPN